jgi:dynein heavy chain
LITYGGRGTDAWDQRCLDAILVRFFAPITLDENYKYSSSGVYFAPLGSKLNDYQNYIESLPLTDEPEIFGMHENANEAFSRNETATVVGTILDLQPLASGGSGGQSPEEM